MTAFLRALAVPTLAMCASLLAIMGRSVAGDLPLWLVLNALLFTVLAIRSHSHQWTIVLVFVHLGALLLGSPPGTPSQWVGVVITGTSLLAFHLIEPWIAWRRVPLNLTPTAAGRLTQPIGVAVLVAASVAILSANRVGEDVPRSILAALALCAVAGTASWAIYAGRPEASIR